MRKACNHIKINPEEVGQYPNILENFGHIIEARLPQNVQQQPEVIIQTEAPVLPPILIQWFWVNVTTKAPFNVVNIYESSIIGIWVVNNPSNKCSLKIDQLLSFANNLLYNLYTWFPLTTINMLIRFHKKKFRFK